MTCKGICTRYKAQKPVGTGRYASGQRRCQICEIFIKWEGLWCPCCGYRLRTKPRNLKYKAKLRARVEADAAASVKPQISKTPEAIALSAQSAEFVSTTLETAVSEGWTKTKTVAQLRKSEGMTIKKAKELVKEAFPAKSKPIAIKA
jgi:hypothetical protein